MIAAPSGKQGWSEMRVTASTESFGMKNLEIRVHIDCVRNPKEVHDNVKLFPTMSAINMGNARRNFISDVYVGLDNEVGSNYFDEYMPES